MSYWLAANCHVPTYCRLPFENCTCLVELTENLPVSAPFGATVTLFTLFSPE